ncbi:MAG: Bug family tripartite tricarboxylate transporter substrate binding protein [Burkholderiales bacterium]
MKNRWCLSTLMVPACAVIAIGLGVVVTRVAAQPAVFPSKPLRIIVPTPPGGGADLSTRLIGKRLSEHIGQPVLVENRPGAGGNVSAEYVARSLPDGYTIYMGAIGPMSISPSLFKSLTFDPLKDFAPITMSVVLSNVLVAHPSVPVTDVQSLLAFARAHPGTLNFGSSGNSSAGHLAGELFAGLGQVELVHVPYKGGGPAMADLLAGQIQLIFATTPSALPHIKAGKLKALGVTTLRRLPLLPDLPTIAEAGLPGYDANNWYCFVAPAKTPPDIVAFLNREFLKALSHAETHAMLTAQGLDPTPTTPEELTAIMKSEIAKWAKVIKDRNIAAP